MKEFCIECQILLEFRVISVRGINEGTSWIHDENRVVSISAY